MFILLIILYVILFIILFTLFLLSLKYKYKFKYSYEEKLDYKFSVSTFFFSFVYQKEGQKEITYFKILSFQKEIKKDSTEKEIEEKVTEKIKKAKETKKKKDKKKRSGFPIKLIKVENIKHLIKLFTDLLKMIIPKNLKLYFLIGLEEPHLNGWLLGYYYSLKGIYPKMPIKIDINWEKEILQSEGKLIGYIVPIQLIFRSLIFIFSLKTIKILWQVFKYYRKY